MRFFVIAIFLHLPLLLLKTEPLKTNEHIPLRIKVLKKKAFKKKTTKDKSLTFTSFNKSLFSNFSGGYVKTFNFRDAGTKKSKLYEVIEEGLTFPESFQKFNIQGAVIAKLYFNNKGEFDVDMSLFYTKNGFLRFHVMTYLEKKLKDFNLGAEFGEGFIDAKFVFKFTVSSLRVDRTFGHDQFVFERVGFKANTELAQGLLEVGQTLISLLNLLKFRPDFLKTNSELAKEQLNLHYLQKIRQHPYFK